MSEEENKVILERLELGSVASNCYILSDETTKEAFIIDPGASPDQIMQRVNQRQLKVKYIILTHGHPDHIGALSEVKEATGAQLAIHSEDIPYLQGSQRPGEALTPPVVEKILNDGDNIEINSLQLQVIHTPGHTPGGICLRMDGVVFSGDTLFNGSIGRSDFPGGNGPQLIASIQTKLMVLPEETVVYPGHGPETTIAIERQYNPFLKG